MTEVKVDKRVIMLPGSWNELSREQYEFVCGLLLEGLSEELYKLRLMRYFMDMPLKLFKPVDIYAIEEQLGFLCKEPDITYNKYSELSIKGKSYYGPADMLEDITLIEFARADQRFLEYVANKDEKDLNELIAVLWRRRKMFIGFQRLFRIWDGDYRVRFQDYMTYQNSNIFARLPQRKKFAIFLWYAACRKRIIEIFADVFDGEKDKDSKEYGWGDIIIDLAGDKFGTIDKTANTLLFTILMYLRNNKKKEEV